MTNARIAAILQETADLLELDGANTFRVRAYRNAAHALEALAESAAERVIDKREPLTLIQGIGADLAEKITVIVETGDLPLRAELRDRIPAGVLDMLRLPGLGPKKAAALFKELGIKSLEELKTACEKHRVQALKGFGKKTEEAILQGIPLAAAAGARLPWHEVDQIVEAVRTYLEESAHVKRLAFAGSYRRGKDTVGDLDVLVTSDSPSLVMEHFSRWPEIGHSLAQGETKQSVRLRSGFQVDVRVVPQESFGAALQYFTGSKEHNIHIRGLAKDKGLKINEYGVYANDKYLAGAEEVDVYQTLGLPLFPPELREGRWEFQDNASQIMRDLVSLQDLHGDLHMHTTASDGSASLLQMAEAAIAHGFQYIAITDHSQRVSMARGLTPERVLAQWQEIDLLNKQLKGRITVLKGIEVDILEAGGLDLPDNVLAQADWVVASIHYGQSQSKDQITARVLEALAHPSVSGIAHPTGRLLGKRPSYELDMEAVFDAAVRFGKCLELNANPLRLDLDDLACASAASRGIPIVINSDSHSANGFDVLRHGIRQARRAGLSKQQVLNTHSWKEVRKILGRN